LWRCESCVDVLETRWSAAKHIFEKKGVKILGAEFTDGDRAKTKSIVSDYIARYGQIDAVWMDAGATSTAAIEAFEDAGKKYPVINGEDQQDFLQKWKSANLTTIAPTYPTDQWRTAIIASYMFLRVKPLPPLHYAMCGCESMPGYPQRWGGK
jgi:ribose transport system substrate-binding protein